MATRARVFNRLGYPMAELDATFDRVWLLNDVGECEFTLSVMDPKARQEFIEYGTYILIEHDKLPVWGGVIDPPRTWSGDRSITVTAYSAEKLLTYRIATSPEKLNGFPGEMFKKIVRLANKEEDLSIRDGDIFTGGKVREETVEEKSLLDDVKRIAERAENDFSIEPAFDSQWRLYFRANWYYQRGIYRSDLVFQEGINLELPGGTFLNEDGELYNDITGEGQGASETSRIKKRVRDEDSISRYRLRQTKETFEGNTKDGTLQNNAQAALNEKKTPKKSFSLFLLDVGNAWSVRLGDIVPVYLYSVGYTHGGAFGVQTLVRVVGMRYTEDEEKVEAIVQEVLE